MYRLDNSSILKRKLKAAFGSSWKQKGDVEMSVQKYFDIVMECCKDEKLVSSMKLTFHRPCGHLLQKKFQITVFDMNKNEDLDLAILSALLKSK